MSIHLLDSIGNWFKTTLLKYSVMCTYKENTNEPCDTCPQVISYLYSCNLLKEIHKELINEEE